MAYESKPLRRQKLRYNNDAAENALTHQLVRDGAKVTPTSAAITIYAPGNATALVTAAAMTVSGTLMTYSVDTTDTDDYAVETGYRADIVVTIGTGESAVTYTDHIVFDVEKFWLSLTVTRDQLLALDEGLRAADHAGDEDFSEVIEAVRDELQLLLETRAIEGGHLVESMVLDTSRVAVPARRKILATVWRNKGDTARAEFHEKEFENLWKAVLAGVRFDTNQDGEEESGHGRVDSIRLVS